MLGIMMIRQKKDIRVCRGVSFMELMIVVIIMAALIGGLMPTMERQSLKAVLNAQVQRIVVDLRLAQQKALAREDGVAYYGVEFFNNLDLGAGATRSGYKVIRYTEVPVTDISTRTVIKGPVASDTPQDLDPGLAFDPRVSFATTTKIKEGSRVVFMPNGSATSNGQTLLTTANNALVLTCGSFSRTVTILPVTGKVNAP
jgi:Tfp pilus assembly protein FimT